MRPVLCLVIAACGSSQHGDNESGDAARIICEAECHREVRCGHDYECQRCEKLPVRNPPVWSAGWAREVAACMDKSSCAHDADEACVVTARRTKAAEACAAKHDRMCVVLDGLTPRADAEVTACYERGDGGSCRPPFDWK